MRDLSHLDRYRVKMSGFLGDAHNGSFILPNPNVNSSLDLRVIASNGMGWDHVSVSTRSRCPTWEEMHWIREQFFAPDEVPVQLGLSRAGPQPYVNNHPFCLHWWRAQEAAYPLPPLECV